MKAHQGLDDVAYQLSGFASTHFTSDKIKPKQVSYGLLANTLLPQLWLDQVLVCCTI